MHKVSHNTYMHINISVFDNTKKELRFQTTGYAILLSRAEDRAIRRQERSVPTPQR